MDEGATMEEVVKPMDAYGHKEWKVIAAVKDAEKELLGSVVQSRFDAEKGFGKVEDAVEHVAEEVAEATGDLRTYIGDYGRETERLVQSTANALGIQSERIGGEINRQVQLTSDNGQRLTQLVGDNAARQVQLTSDATQRLVQGTANNTDTLLLNSTNAIGLQAERNATANALAFKDVQLLQERIAAQAQLYASQVAASAAADAARNAAAIAAQLCECCCEIKEKIGDDGDETRELINKQYTEKLRDEATALRERLSEERHSRMLEATFNKVTQVGAGNIAVPTATRAS